MSPLERHLMSFLAAIVVLSLTIAKCHADEWTHGEVAAEATYLTLHVIDWRQTVYITKHPERLYETNPMLGRRPSESRVNTWFLSMAFAQIGIANLLPRDWRRIWIGSGIVLEASMTAHNEAIGVGFSW